MSSRSDPFDDLERMFDRMTTVRDGRAPVGRGDWEPFAGGQELAVDLLDTDDAYVVTVDVPGFDRNELDLRVSDRTLRIDGEREESTDEAEENYLRRERRRASIRRSIGLPAPVKPDDVTAKLHNGILTIVVPKAEPVPESRRVEIDAE